MRQLQTLLQLASLFDCLDDALVWVKDREGRYCWVNRAFLINYAMNRRQGVRCVESDELVGKTDYDLSPSFLAEQFRLDDEYVLTGKRIVNRIELVGQPDGLTVWNVTNKVPLVAADGSIIGTAGITRRLSTLSENPVPGTEFGPVLAYMRDHYRSSITNRQLARLAHMSVRTFERRFHASFHLTPQEYLRRLRMSMASRALVYTSHRLADVALRCGFVDQSHAYREHYTRASDDAAPGTNSVAREQ
jgi:AraC-like DNA-binding protein